jgi:hypothetical protein
MTMHPLNDSTQNAIMAALRLLDRQTFAIFKTGITEEEARQLHLLGVKSNAQYDNFGESDSLVDTVRVALADQGQNDSPAATTFVSGVFRLANATVKAFNCETAWVCLRSFTPELKFTARWHTDGRFFADEGAPLVQHKAVFAWSGKASLFATIAEERCPTFNQIEQQLGAAYAERAQSLIPTLQAKLNKLICSTDVVRPKAPYEGAVFNVGDPNYAAIHSEPEFDRARWFMSVVPGSRDQILELKRRWKK